MGRVNGKVAIVTGAARGQGEAEARILIAEGAKVMLTDILDSKGEALAQELGDNACYMSHNVCDEAAWTKVVEATEAKFGPVTVLINNAGILKINALPDTPLEEYMQVINVNQVGVFLGMKHITGSMKKAGGGSIVNISSIDGLVGMSHAISYVASKFAVRGMTKSAAVELGPFGIRVNSIHPGGVETPMVTQLRGDEPQSEQQESGGGFGSDVPLGRIGQPEDIAKLALFLASDDSAYSSGGEFIIDGGMTAGFTIGS
ncbi:MAG: glucose 1-dehydrogenase [Pseudomonadales bacterium]|nr:glucose 1-dehydrogenase [Pseudomonadales bacterium]